MKLHIIYHPNAPRGKGHGGMEVWVHKAGCRDIARDVTLGRGATSHYSSAFETQHEAAEDFYDDFIREGSMTKEHAWELTWFAPCCSDLPVGKPSESVVWTMKAPVPFDGYVEVTDRARVIVGGKAGELTITDPAVTTWLRIALEEAADRSADIARALYPEEA